MQESAAVRDAVARELDPDFAATRSAQKLQFLQGFFAEHVRGGKIERLGYKAAASGGAATAMNDENSPDSYAAHLHKEANKNIEAH